MNALREILLGAKSLFVGMKITLTEFFKPTITTQYPHETLPIPARFRGHIQLTPSPEGGENLCIACKSCEKACPSDCITVDGSKRAVGGKKPDVFKLDYTKCSLCGLCIDACPVKPVKAIEFSKRYNLASVTNTFKDMDLLERYKKLVPEKPAAPTPAPAEAPAPAAVQQPQSQPQQ